MAGDLKLGGNFLGPEISITMHLHAECPGAAGDFLTDAAHSDEADAFSEKLAAGHAVPPPGASAVDGVGEIFRKG